jgi:flagellar hook-associated protein 2
MGRISSSIGLITGIPIQDTVDKLMEVSARPRDMLKDRTDTLGKQRVAVTELMAKLLAVQFSAKNLGKDAVFQQKTAATSNASLLDAAVTGQPAAGRYVYTPVRPASTQQLLSSVFASDDDPLGAGSFSLQYGGELDKGAHLGLLNGGQGISRGKIRITDRSGASAEVDLRFAATVDDVIEAVNNASGVNVRLSTQGDRFVLTDETGQSVSNLRVEQIGNATTAADLGLAAIDAASDQAVGGDVLRLYDNVPLNQLLDGRGVGANTALPDLEVHFRDGSDPLFIDFDALAKTAGKASGTRAAANGSNAQLRFTATATGADFDGYTISYVDDPAVTAGNESVVYDKDAKTLTFHIDQDATTADDIIAALAASDAKDDFTADNVGDGSGLISTTDGAVTRGGAEREATDEVTLGDLIDTINAAGGGRLKAELRPDGDGLQITDLTEDRGGQFTIASAFDSPALDALGLDGATAAGGVITGSRLLGGLKTVLLGSLNGGQGFDLGQLDLTDRSGASVSVDLSAAETLDDVLDAINTQAAAAGVKIAIGVNDSRTGLELTDTSGAAGPLVVANDAKNTADQLGLTTNANVSSVKGASLRRQSVSANTRLAELNGGAGVYQGQFQITDSSGAGATITIGPDIDTVGQLLEEINNKAPNVEARINDAGAGIVLVDEAGGDGKLMVSEVGGGSAAADLHLLGTAQNVEIDGETQQAIVGGNRFEITLDDDDTLDDWVEKLNDSGAGVVALKLGDGSLGNPFRLALFGKEAGHGANLLFDTGGVDFSISETSRAQDALLMFGSADSGAGLLVSSKTNTFADILPGVELTVKGRSTDPVAVEIKATDEKLLSTVHAFVDAYNAMRDKLDDQTAYDAESGVSGPLHGTVEALRVDVELSGLLTGRFFGAGSIQSLESLGIGVNDQGKLSLDESKLKAAFADDPEAVTEFFTKEDLGVAAKLDKLIEQMAGEDHSLLVNRAQTLGTRIDSNQQRIKDWNERLDRQRESLLKEFYNMELAIGKLKNNQTALNSIQVVPPLSAAPAS